MLTSCSLVYFFCQRNKICTYIHKCVELNYYFCKITIICNEQKFQNVVIKWKLTNFVRSAKEMSQLIITKREGYHLDFFVAPQLSSGFSDYNNSSSLTVLATVVCNNCHPKPRPWCSNRLIWQNGLASVSFQLSCDILEDAIGKFAWDFTHTAHVTAKYQRKKSYWPYVDIYWSVIFKKWCTRHLIDKPDMFLLVYQRGTSVNWGKRMKCSIIINKSSRVVCNKINLSKSNTTKK